MTARPVPSDVIVRTNAAFEAFIDRECLVDCADPAPVAVADRMGAASAGPGKADHLVLDTADETPLVARAEFDAGSALRPADPRVERAVTATARGMPKAFWGARDRALRCPAFPASTVRGCWACPDPPQSRGGDG